jgi:hypothetical protein
MEDKRKVAAPVFVALILLMPFIYMGGYYALIRRSHIVSLDDPFEVGEYSEYYEFGNPLAKILFHPMHLLDVKLRPAYWTRPAEYSPLDEVVRDVLRKQNASERVGN